MEELNKHSKVSPFKVPDNYFNSFQDRLKVKMESVDSKDGRGKSFYLIKPVIAIAASLLLILTFWFLFSDKNKEKQQITEEKVEQLPELKYFESVNTNELIELVASEGLNPLDFNIDMEQDVDIIIDQFEESTIIDAI